MICRETIMETDDPSLVVSAVKSEPPPRRGALGCFSLSLSLQTAPLVDLRCRRLQKKKKKRFATGCKHADNRLLSSSAHKQNRK